MTTPKPSVGRIVHFQTYGTPGGEFPPQTIAAIITAVDEEAETVSLLRLYPGGGLGPLDGVRFAGETPTPGRWNWPPHV